MVDETPSGGTPREGQITTDLDTIREWADDRSVVPVRTGVMDPEMEDSGMDSEMGDRGMGGEAPVGLLPSREVDDHEEIDWETFHDELRESDAAVVARGTGDRERLAVVDYDAAIANLDLDREEFEERLMQGEIVHGEITETTVVETRVVEEAEIESELVDTELVSERVLDAELVGRTCTNCEIIADDPADPMAMFDEARYLESRSRAGGMEGTRTGEAGTDSERGMSEDDETIDELAGTEFEGDQPHGTESGMETSHGTESGTSDAEHGTTPETEPYHAELSIDEEWQVTRELIDRLTIETRIVDTDITELDSIEHAGFDVKGLQRTILESGIFEFETDPERVLAEHEIRTELSESDAVHTYLNRRRIVQDEVTDHRTARVPVTDFEHTEMGIVDSMEIESDIVSEEPAAGADAPAAGGPGMDEPAMDEPAMDESGARDVDATGEIEAGEMDEARSMLTDSDQGKAVVDATGHEVGMIVEVDESAGTAYVDPNPGIAERIMSKMGWGDADSEDYPLTENQIEHITDDEIHLIGQGGEKADGER